MTDVTEKPDAFELDLSKLKNGDNAEKQELYLFQWLSTLQNELQTLPEDTILQHQTELSKQLIQLLHSSSPRPSRPIRQLVAKSLLLCYTRGDTRNLFENIASFNSTLNGAKLEKDTRLAILHVLGVVMETIGGQVISLLNDSTAACIKIVRTNSHPLIIRSEALSTLSKVIRGCGRGLQEPLIKDIVKVLRPLISDKAFLIQQASVECFHSLFTSSEQFQTSPDLEALMPLLFKTLDNSNRAVRLAIASFIANVLAATQANVDAFSADLAPGSVMNVTKKGAKTTAKINDQVDSPTSGLNKTTLSTDEMLQRLSTVYNAKTTTAIVRTAIIETYANLFRYLGTSYVELHYRIIARHLLTYVVSHARLQSDRHEVLSARGHVRLLFRQVIGSRLLSEQGQIAAIKELINGTIKEWPAVMPGSLAPHKLALASAIEEVAGLLTDLGGAAVAVQDVAIDPIVQLLAHPSWTVQITTSWCLRCLAYSIPSQLSPLIKNVMGLVSKDMSNLGISGSPPDINRRAIGHAHGLAALMSVVPFHPLHVSFDLCTNVFSMSTSLLKASGDKELRFSGVQIQVAWTLIGSLMGLGPNFVQLHLPQLLLLWKNALPRPSGKDSNTTRGENEWAFLIHVRECCLSAILSFLNHNGKSSLVTADVARRLVALLNNTLAFLNIVSAHIPHINDESMPRFTTALRLVDRDLMLRRRVFQCFDQIAFHPACEPLYQNLLASCVALFADPERYTGSSVSASIAASSGTFTSLWTMTDEYAYGVSSLMHQMNVNIATASMNDDNAVTTNANWLNRDAVEAAIEDQLEQPIMGAIEHDSMQAYRKSARSLEMPLPVPPATSLVDATLELFSQLFPMQAAPLQESLLETLITSVRSPKLDKNPGRKMAVLVNAVIALLGSTRKMQASGSNKNELTIKDRRIGAIAQEILQEAVLHHDPFVRNAGSEALGRLTTVCGTTIMTSQIQILVDQVVNNRDPDARAGCALALGDIYKYVGGMAAGPHLKTIVGILTSLSNDPHPVVHFWALSALASTIDAAGLSFSNYVSGTLAAIAKLYMTETHEPSGANSISISNLAMDLPAYQMFGRIIDAIIGVLGPEIAMSSKLRELVLHLIEELMHESDTGVMVEGTRCLQHLIMFVPNAMTLQRLVSDLQTQLATRNVPLKTVAINSLYQLVQRDASAVFKASAAASAMQGDRSDTRSLGEKLFALLDTDPYLDGVRDIIYSWLKQTAADSPLAWVELCRRIMSRSGSASGGGSAPPPEASILDLGNDVAVGDEEVESFSMAAEGENTQGPSATLSRALQDSKLPSRWRTQLFALRCLNEVVRVIENETTGTTEARRKALKSRKSLIPKISELIKMAFTASTAVIDDMRLEGLEILRNVVESFAAIPDPDFEEATILEQYQAQIGAALTPAFGADSSAEILARAVQVCANFVGSGIVRELSDMGRILKLLTGALESCQGDMTSLGDVKNLSPHAAVMIKMSILDAWADLQVASAKQTYLVEVLKPHLAMLCPLWLMSLREYARIKIEPDNQNDSNAFDSAYAGLTREVVLPFYDRCWTGILDAVTTLIIAKNTLIKRALAGEENLSKDSTAPAPINGAQNEPLMFFFVLYGLCFESITRIPTGSTSAKDITLLRICLDAIRGLMTPAIAGNAILDETNFSDLVSLFDRLVLAEGQSTQRLVLLAANGLVEQYGSKFMEESDDKSGLKVDNKAYRLLSIVTSTLQRHIPALAQSSGYTRPIVKTHDTAALIVSAIEAFNFITQTFPLQFQPHFFAIGFYVYSCIISDEKLQDEVVPGLLPGLRNLISTLVASNVDLKQRSRILHGFVLALTQNIENVRGREGATVEMVCQNNIIAGSFVYSGLVTSNIDVDSEALADFERAVCSKMNMATPRSAAAAISCTQSLLTVSTRAASRSIGVAMVKGLLPDLLLLVHAQKALVGELKDRTQDPRAQILDEAMKTIVGSMTSVQNLAGQETNVGSFLSIIVQTLVHLLDTPPLDNVTPLHALTIPHLVGLATSQPTLFKDIVATLGLSQKETLEAGIRHHVIGGNNKAKAVSAAPTISLKSFV